MTSLFEEQMMKAQVEALQLIGKQLERIAQRLTEIGGVLEERK